MTPDKTHTWVNKDGYGFDTEGEKVFLYSHKCSVCSMEKCLMGLGLSDVWVWGYGSSDNWSGPVNESRVGTVFDNDEKMPTCSETAMHEALGDI